MADSNCVFCPRLLAGEIAFSGRSLEGYRESWVSFDDRRFMQSAQSVLRPRRTSALHRATAWDSFANRCEPHHLGVPVDGGRKFFAVISIVTYEDCILLTLSLRLFAERVRYLKGHGALAWATRLKSPRAEYVGDHREPPRRARRSHLPRVVAGALLASIALTAHAVTCLNNLPASNPDSSYTVHGDGTATDTRTGLTWKVCSEGQVWNAGACSGTASMKPWATALSDAEAHVFAAHSDWRLPNVKELRSLIEECRASPSINDTVFPSTPASGFFWSSSPVVIISTDAWIVGTAGAYATGAYRGNPYNVRLVRGGQSFANPPNLPPTISQLSVAVDGAGVVSGGMVVNDPEGDLLTKLRLRIYKTVGGTECTIDVGAPYNSTQPSGTKNFSQSCRSYFDTQGSGTYYVMIDAFDVRGAQTPYQAQANQPTLVWNAIGLTGLGLTPYKILPGQTANLTPLPANAGLGACTSNNTGIATVSGSVVTGVSRGEAIITCGAFTIEIQVRRPWVQNINPSTAPPFVLTEFAITGEDLDFVAEVELDGCVGKMTERPRSFTPSDTFTPGAMLRYFSCLPVTGGNRQLRFKALNGTQNFADWRSAPAVAGPTPPGCAVAQPLGCAVAIAAPGSFIAIADRLNVFAELRDNPYYGRGGKMLWNEMPFSRLMELQDRLRQEGLDVSTPSSISTARENAQTQLRAITRDKLVEAIGTADGFTWKNWLRTPLRFAGGVLTQYGEYEPADWAQLTSAIAMNGALAVADATGIGNAVDAARYAGKSWPQLAKMSNYSSALLRSGDSKLVRVGEYLVADESLITILKVGSKAVDGWTTDEKERVATLVEGFSQVALSVALSHLPVTTTVTTTNMPYLTSWLRNGAPAAGLNDFVRDGIIEFSSATAVHSASVMTTSGFLSATQTEELLNGLEDAAIGAVPIVGAWVDTYNASKRIADRVLARSKMFATAEDINNWFGEQGEEINRQYVALKLALLFEEADKQLGREALRDPLPTTTFGLPASWTTQAASIQRVVVITHGWNSEANAWPDALVRRFCGRIGGTVQTEIAAADKTISGVSAWCMQGGWLVAGYNWHQDARITGNESSVARLPSEALVNAKRHGQDFAQLLKDVGITPIFVQAIGHSAGSGFVEEYLGVFKAMATPPTRHATFLDAYCPDILAGCNYGESATWAEQYVDRRTVGDGTLLFTNETLANAYNFDVTDLDPVSEYDGELDAVAFHAFPYRVYVQSASSLPLDPAWGGVRTNVIGAPLSALPRGLTSSAAITSYYNGVSLTYPRGFRCVVRGTNEAASATSCLIRNSAASTSGTTSPVAPTQTPSTTSYCGDSVNLGVTTSAGFAAILQTCGLSAPSAAPAKAIAAASVNAASVVAVASARSSVITSSASNQIDVSYTYVAGAGATTIRMYLDDGLVFARTLRVTDVGRSFSERIPLAVLSAGQHYFQSVVTTDSVTQARVDLTSVNFALREANTSGVCGRQNGITSAAKPTELCAAGQPSAVSSGTAWTWSCGGLGASASSANCSAPVASCSLDVDGDGLATPAIDGVILMRYLMGFKGAALTAGLTIPGPRSNHQRIEEYLASPAMFDVFGRISAGAVPGTVDGLILGRVMAQQPDAGLLQGVAVPAGAATTAAQVRARVLNRCFPVVPAVTLSKLTEYKYGDVWRDGNTTWAMAAKVVNLNDFYTRPDGAKAVRHQLFILSMTGNVLNETPLGEAYLQDNTFAQSAIWVQSANTNNVEFFWNEKRANGTYLMAGVRGIFSKATGTVITRADNFVDQNMGWYPWLAADGLHHFRFGSSEMLDNSAVATTTPSAFATRWNTERSAHSGAVAPAPTDADVAGRLCALHCAQ